jgi:thiol-disulfide isomerase/thioredoxin
MRTLLLTLFIGISSVSAQTASNFTINDVDGVSRDLFTELDAGNVVVLKFFTNWCSICNNTADEVVTIYNDYQTNGDPVVFWALDRDQNETNVQATAYRDNNSIPFPVIGEAYSVAQQFGVVYQPEYYIVRPDRSYVQRTNYNSMKTAVDEALAALGTSVEEAYLRENFRITSNSVSWLGQLNEHIEFTVFDTQGKVISTTSIQGGETVAVDLKNGVYLYRITDKSGASYSDKIGVAN